MKRQVGMKLDEGLIAAVDAARGGLSRTEVVELALGAWLEGSAVVRAVSTERPGGLVPRVVVRPAKPLRLAVAADVLTSAQAKAGLRPVDWRARADG